METEIKVSIIVNTYNHEKFIADTLNGIVIQKVNFPFEVLIHDDASNDNTVEIIKDYISKYSHIDFKPIFQTVNQYSQNIKIGRTFQYPRTKGKYIAICEGDDYWTDPLKLQKQVDFLEGNPEYVLCFHNCILLRDDKFTETILDKYDYKSNQEIPPMEFQNWIAQTATIVYRNNPKIPKLLSSFNHVVFGDVLFRRVIVDFGKVYLINEVMSVYRKHEMGITNRRFSNNKRDLKKIEQFKEMYSYFGDRWLKQPIAKSYYFIFKRLLKERKIFSALKYLSISFYYNPKDIFKRIKNDIKSLI